MTSAFDFEKLMLATLRSSSDLAEIVGNRIYYLTMPQTATLPCVTWQRVTANTINTLMGASGLTQLKIQVDCWSRNMGECKSIAKAIQAVMPANGPWGAHLDTDQDLYDSTTKYYRIIMEFTVWFCESAVE